MDALFPPGPQKSLILGDAPHFKNNPLDYMAQAARAYGDLVHFRFGPTHAYLLTNPRDAHYVLVERPDLFDDRPNFFRALNSAMGHDLRAPKDKVAKNTQRHGSFKAEWLDDQIDWMAQASATTLDKWQGGDPLPLLKALALRLVSATLFGEADSPAAHQMMQALDTLGDEGRFRSPLTLPNWVPTASNRAHARAQHSLKHTVAEAVQDAKSGSILSRLLDAGDEAQAVKEMLALFRAGQAVVAQTTAWAWSLLAANAEASAALRAEVSAVLGDRLPTAVDLPNLPYCEMVFKETLRLHPAVTFISRQARKETRLGDYYAPAGSTIFVSPTIIHHSPRYYASPEVFLPERFSDSFARRATSYTYLPFGAGVYTEAERAYATTLGKLILATVAQRCSLSSSSPLVPATRPQESSPA